MLSLDVFVADAGLRADAHHPGPPTLHIPKNRSNPLSPGSSSASSLADAQRKGSRSRKSGDELTSSIAEEDLEGLARCVIPSTRLVGQALWTCMCMFVPGVMLQHDG